MRADKGWSDIVIRNISPRGMLIKSASPPLSGAYVEIRCARLTAVGRAVWAKDNLIGIRLQDRLQIDALLGVAAKARIGNPPAEARAYPPRSLAGIAERSRDRARKFQYLALLLVITLSAAALASTVATTLAAPFEAVRDGMDRP